MNVPVSSPRADAPFGAPPTPVSMALRDDRRILIQGQPPYFQASTLSHPLSTIHSTLAHGRRVGSTGAVLERGLDTSNGLDFVRERLALVGKTLFLVGGAPFVAVVKGPVALGHLAASWTMGLLWLLAWPSPSPS